MLDSVRVDFSFVRVEKRSDSSFVMATVVLLSRNLWYCQIAVEASSFGEARDGEDGEELEQVIEEMKSSLEFISMFFFFVM